MNRVRSFRRIGLAGVLGLLLAACGPAAAPEAQEQQPGAAEVKVVEGQIRVPDHPFPALIPPDQSEQDPVKNGKRGGHFRTTVLDPPHLDISLTSSSTVYNSNDQVYNKLVRAKVDARSNTFIVEIEGDLAKSWEMSPDAKAVTFKLREGVKFQNLPPMNGRELTADDVLYSFNRYASGGVQRSTFELVDKMEAPDKYTVKITLKAPQVDFVRSLGAMAFIVPKELVESEGGNLRKRAAGTGAYILEEWVPKQHLKYRRNPDYFDKPYPFVDQVTTFIIPDTATARAAYRSKQLDTVTVTRVDEARDILKTDPDTVFQSVGIAGTWLRGNVNAIQMRLDKAPFKDVRVRRALSMAIDRKAIADTEFEGGLYLTMGMPWPYVFDHWPTLGEWGPWYQYNPVEAKKLLAEAGFPNGFKFELVSWYLRSRAETLVPSFKEIGVTMTHREVDNPTHVEVLNQKRFEEATGSIWGIPAYEVDSEIYPWWHSKGSKNFDNLNDPDLDKLLEAQRVEPDPDKRKAILKKIWDIQLDQVYQIWVPVARSMYGWRSNIKNLRSHAFLGAPT